MCGLSRRGRVGELAVRLGERFGGLVSFVGGGAQRNLHRVHDFERTLHLLPACVDELALLRRDVVGRSAATPAGPYASAGMSPAHEHELGRRVEVEQAEGLAIEIEDHAVHLDVARRRAARPHRVLERGEHASRGSVRRPR